MFAAAGGATEATRRQVLWDAAVYAPHPEGRGLRCPMEGPHARSDPLLCVWWSSGTHDYND